MRPIPIKAWLLGFTDGAQEGNTNTGFGLYTMVLQVEIYATKACIMENTEKGYTGRNIYMFFLTGSHQGP